MSSIVCLNMRSPIPLPKYVIIISFIVFDETSVYPQTYNPTHVYTHKDTYFEITKNLFEKNPHHLCWKRVSNPFTNDTNVIDPKTPVEEKTLLSSSVNFLLLGAKIEWELVFRVLFTPYLFYSLDHFYSVEPLSIMFSHLYKNYLFTSSSEVFYTGHYLRTHCTKRVKSVHIIMFPFYYKINYILLPWYN